MLQLPCLLCESALLARRLHDWASVLDCGRYGLHTALGQLRQSTVVVLAQDCIADFKAEIACNASFSSALNSANSFSRMAVAWSRASWFSAISFSKFLISVFRRALEAVNSSILVVGSSSRKCHAKQISLESSVDGIG